MHPTIKIQSLNYGLKYFLLCKQETFDPQQPKSGLILVG